jgi:hypothetical protein
MSGGHFGYIDSRIRNFIEELDNEIINNESKEYPYLFSTVERLKLLVSLSALLSDAIHQCDYMYSGDIDAEDFNERFDAIHANIRVITGDHNV